MWMKAVFHVGRIRRIPWQARMSYFKEALERNWDWAMESYFTTHSRTMLWLKQHFGVSLSEAAFNNVYASLSVLVDSYVRPYPGKLNLFRAQDVPNFNGMDETLGWKNVAQEGVQVTFVPGDHVSMFKKPHVSSLARLLQTELRRSEASLSGK